MKKFIKELIPYVVIVILVVIIRSYIITPVVVVGSSMENTLHDDEILLLSKISYRVGEIKRYDVVVIDNEIHDKLIKRVVGLPGDKVEYRNNKLIINGKYVEDKYAYNETEDFTVKSISGKDKIPEGYYLVLGDNRKVSIDSRNKDVGLIKREDIIGKTVVRFWPINKVSLVK